MKTAHQDQWKAWFMNLKVDDLFEQLVRETDRAIKRRACSDPVMVGIHTGGVWVAEKLHAALKIESPLNHLNINYHRDDLGHGGIHTQSKPSLMCTDINDRHVVLVDDVLQTGRTVRAALNEVFDHGRPQSILLAVLLARKQRELPICADAIGLELDLQPEQKIKLKGPDPLRLEVD